MDAIYYPKLLLEDGSYLLQEDGVGKILLTNEITNSAFLQWLRAPVSRTTLLAEMKFAYQSAGSPAEGTVRLSDRGYVDESESPPQPYAAVIEGAPSFERSIDVTKLGGRGTASLGSLTLANADGNADYLLRYIVDGRDVTFLVGDPTWERSQFRQIGLGSVAAMRADDDARLTITLRDKGLLLDATIIGDAMTTGPNEGKPKPVLFGQVYNFDLTPYLYDETGPSYYFNNYAQDSSLAFGNVIVRDAGVSLINAGFSDTNANLTADASTNLMARTAHTLLENDVIRFSGTDPFAGLSQLTQYWVISDGFTANAFKVSETRGGSAVDITGTTFSGTLSVSSRRYYVDAAAASITLSAEPDGRVTADILAQGTSGDAAIQDVPHAGFRYILDTWTRLTSADRDTLAFANLVAAQQAAGTRWGRAVLDRTNVMDILDEIAVATNSWYGWDRNGLLSVGKLDLANLDSATATETIVEDDIVGDPSYENQVIPFGRLIVDANANVVTQTDGLATSVSAEDRSTYGQKFRTRVKSTDPTGEQYLTDWWTYHKSAIDSKPLETVYVGNAAQDFCDERQALFAPFTTVFSCTVGMDKYLLDPGDCVEVTYPRYNLDAGVNFRVASVTVRPGEKAIDLKLVRQTVPNWDALGVGVTTPGAPTIGTATAGNLKATVTFTAPASNGGGAITAYRVTSTPSSITADGSASPIVVTGLSNGTGYTFKVKALNSAGYGAESSASNSATPAATVPDPPTSASAAAASSSTATVTFTAPIDNGGAAISGYTATSSPGGLTGSGASSPVTVTGLSGGIDYTFTVVATNANGNSVASAASNTVRLANRAISLTPSNVQRYNIFAAAGYPTDSVEVTVTLTGDCYDGEALGYPAMTTGSGWVAGSTIRIVVGTVSTPGYVIGPGGIGGLAGFVNTDGSGLTYPGNGTQGFVGIELLWDVVIDMTYGYIFGGGGGGAGAAAWRDGPGGNCYNGGTGGGGAGYGLYYSTESGSPERGGRLTGGAGGFRGISGGAGGASGMAGEDAVILDVSYVPLTASGSPGAAGKAIALNGHTVTWIGYDAARVKGSVA